MKVLSIVANLKPVENSVSLQIEREFVSVLKTKRAVNNYVRVDVYRDEIPLLDVT